MVIHLSLSQTQSPVLLDAWPLVRMRDLLSQQRAQIKFGLQLKAQGFIEYCA